MVLLTTFLSNGKNPSRRRPVFTVRGDERQSPSNFSARPTH